MQWTREKMFVFVCVVVRCAHQQREKNQFEIISCLNFICSGSATATFANVPIHFIIFALATTPAPLSLCLSLAFSSLACTISLSLSLSCCAHENLFRKWTNSRRKFPYWQIKYARTNSEQECTGTEQQQQHQLRFEWNESWKLKLNYNTFYGCIWLRIVSLLSTVNGIYK